MPHSINLTGQWIGEFVYGNEYGEDMYGEKVQFRLFLEEVSKDQFEGTSVDIEGFGANMDKAIIKGFIEDDFISFTKEYPKYFIIDENGENLPDPSMQKPRLSYTGVYKKIKNCLVGNGSLSQMNFLTEIEDLL